MPIGAPPTYPVLSDVMLLARTYVNDTFKGATATAGEGQILTNTAVFTVPMVNASIRELYRKLGNMGTPTLIRDNFILTGLEAVVNVDPAVQVNVNFTAYNNGTSDDTNLKLPADLLALLNVAERQNGSGNPFLPMFEKPYGLPSRQQQTYLGDWEYRGDALYMVGATLVTDIRLRYVCQLPGNVTGDGSDFANLSVPIQDSEDALAWLICTKYGFRLDGADEQYTTAKQEATEAISDLALRQTRARQGARIERVPYDGGNGNGGNFGY